MSKTLFPRTYLVTSHTDHVGPGSTFVAVKGMKDDGIRYIEKALVHGATKIVVDKAVSVDESLKALINQKNAVLEYVPNTRQALALLSAQAYGYPAKDLKIIGITGTKGKTTTAFLIEHILRTAGYKTALVSTVKNQILDVSFDAQLTTPQPDYLQAFFSLCKERGVTHVIMEVAAQAVSLSRVETLSFDAALFTNFSLEHSEFYATQDDYFKAKCALFNQLGSDALALFNADDTRVATFGATVLHAQFYSIERPATISGHIEQSDLTTLKMRATSQNNAYAFSMSSLLGAFNASNIVAAIGVAERYGIPVKTSEAALTCFLGVPGRLQRFSLPNKAVAFIDNAHTPSSFEAILSALRPLSPHIIAVFGAGGDRDALKRPLMGAIAASYADSVILTTDNPRSEDPQTIIEEIYAGINQENRRKVVCKVDREQAIRAAYMLSKPGTIIALLGKGPVEYQHIKDVKIPFSEASILRSL